MIEKRIVIKITQKQAQYLAKTLNRALKSKTNGKVKLIVTDLDIQVEIGEIAF